jgi:DNA-binding CsgD family transcriptional regulator
VNARVLDFARGAPLSPRQLEVLQYAAAGLSSAETGGEMGIAEETVKSTRRVVLAKLNARSMTRAVAIGFETGLLAIPPTT